MSCLALQHAEQVVVESVTIPIPFEAGERPAILSRGYARRSKARVVVVNDGTGMAVSASEAGDEPCMLARALPDVPLMQEVLPGFEPAPAWTGVYGPARMPQALTRRLHADINRALSVPDVVQKINDMGFDVVLANSPEDFAARNQRSIDLTARIAKAANIEAPQ